MNPEPFLQLDRVIHEKGRFAIMSMLAALPELDHVSPETHLADRMSYLEVLKIGGPPSPDEVATAHARLKHLASRYRAILAVPLSVPEEAFGALTLYYRQPRGFVEEDVNLASAFANQAALVIQNSSALRARPAGGSA